MVDAALDGLRVLEVGDFISAAYATKLLADLGADVIKVEPPDGDSVRRQGPFPGGTPNGERGGLHLFLDTNKRGVTLDAATEEGRARLDGLTAWADVLVHNLSRAELDARGITPEALCERHPRLVVVSITPFGYDTPYRDWKAYALNTTVASGLSYRIGDPERAPLWLPHCAADFQGGVHGAIAALAALRARRATGRGQHVWLSTVEVMGVYLRGSGLPGFILQGQLRGRAGTRMDAFYPWEVVPVADGYFEVVTMVDDQWRRFVELMGDPPWAADERLQNRWLAFQWAEELDAHWHPWMRERTKADLAALFAEHRIAFQPVNAIDEVVASEHLRERGFWQQVEHPAAGRYTTPGAPYRLSETPWAIRRPPPLLGQHNDDLAALAPRDREPHDRGRTAADAPPPLEGIRVIDHGHVWAGPLLGRTFADLGAEVIKVQAPDRASGIVMAGLSTLDAVGDDDDGAIRYHGLDRGKHSVTLDLTSADGKAIYRRLVAASDIVIENFSRRVMPALGLGYEALAEVNPRIIMASLSATGATRGPWSDLLTYGPSLGALYGIKGLLGYHDDPHPIEDMADLDPTATAHAFLAICAALEYRERTGRGQHIEMAQGEASIQRIAEPLMDYFFNGVVAGTQGNRYAGFAPHGVYRAAGDDRWIAIAVREDGEWDALVRTAGAEAPALTAPRFATLEGRLAAQDALDGAVEAWTQHHDAMALTERLQATGVAAFPVMGPPDLAGDRNYDALRTAHVRMAPAVEIPAERLYEGIPWKLTATPGVIQGPRPELGEDNDRIFGDLLGLSAGELASLRERAVI